MKRIVSIFLVVSMLICFMIPAGAEFENTYKNTGNQTNDIIGVAKTQIGYKESDVNGQENYTKYGAHYNMQWTAWCAIFIVWCAEEANVPRNTIPLLAGCGQLKNWYKDRGLWHNSAYRGGNYKPKAGDIVFYDWSVAGSADHVGLVTGSSSTSFTTIEGNYSDKVQTRMVSFTSNQVLGYASPKYNQVAVMNEKPTGTYKIKADPYLNIRTGEGGAVVGNIPDGETVTVTEVKNGWGKVTYNGVTGYISLDYAVFVSASISSISVATKPTKTQYEVGESFDKSGLVVKAVYSDSTTKTVTDYTLSGFNSTSIGEKTIKVTYSGKTTTFTVDVVKQYKVSADGGLNLRNAANGSTVYTTIPNGTVVNVFEISNGWAKLRYSSYTGWVSTDYLQEVANTSDYSIKLSASTLKMSVSHTQILTATTTPEGKSVTWTSSATNVVTVKNGLLTAIKEGSATITASFTEGGKTYSAKCTVTVEPKTVKSVSIKTYPKTEYNVGESLSTSGLVLNVTYTDSTTTTISSGFTVSGYNANNIGSQTITVTYMGAKTTYTVNVSGSPVPFKVLEYNGHIYSFYDYDVSYTQAVDLCKKLGGHIATITSSGEASTINKILAGAKLDKYWIGLTDRNSASGKYSWETGESLSFTNWSIGQPNANSGKNAVIVEAKNSGKWNDVSVDYSGIIGFVCEIDAEKVKPAEIKKYGSNTYYRFDGAIAFNEAKALSEWLGGHLVTITSKGENDFVKDLMSKGKADSYWTGATDVNSEGKFTWVTGESFSYTNWSSSNPDNTKGREHFVEMAKSDSYKWNDVQASGRDGNVTGFVLEIEGAGITLNKTDVSVIKGTQYQLTATVNSNIYSAKNVKWTSKNTGVAKVSSSGVITAVSSGSTLIVAEVGTTVVYCKVTVIG